VSHGPKISIHVDSLSRKDREEIRELMKVAEAGDEEERLAVAEYLNDQLSEMDGHLFGFWNHRPGQEVEEYDDLISYFRVYARITSKIKVCTSVVTADYKDYRWLFDTGKEYEVEEDDEKDNTEWFEELELKRKIREGEEAKEALEDFREKNAEEDQ